VAKSRNVKQFKVYLAGPLFSVAERAFNERLAVALGRRMPNLSFILPQKYAALTVGQEGFAKKVFEHCIGSIRKADVVLCILDGPDVDSGTCIEMGCAHAWGKLIVGVRTDFRGSEERGLNIMVSRVCKEMIWLPDSRLTESEVTGKVVAALKRVLS
jgi:nucleoside 2-deoxyribosyltransferase